MNCTVCTEPLEELVMVVSDITGHHQYVQASCVEGSPHRHESCVEASYDDSPVEMQEGARRGRNKGGF